MKWYFTHESLEDRLWYKLFFSMCKKFNVSWPTATPVCQDEKFQMVGADGNVWRKTHNSSGDYSFIVTRDMIRQEVSALSQAQ